MTSRSPSVSKMKAPATLIFYRDITDSENNATIHTGKELKTKTSGSRVRVAARLFCGFDMAHPVHWTMLGPYGEKDDDEDSN